MDDVLTRDLAFAYDEAAPHYDAWRWQALWSAQEEPRVVRRIRALSPRTALDVGTGTGRYALRLTEAGAEVLGVDVSEAMLALARTRCPNVTFLKRSALDLEGLGTFDLVLGARMLCHLPDLREVLRTFQGVLRPGGTLILTDLDPDHVVERTYLPAAHGFRPVPTWKRSLSEVVRAAEEAGLTTRRARRHVITGEMLERFSTLRLGPPGKALFWVAEFMREG